MGKERDEGMEDRKGEGERSDGGRKEGVYRNKMCTDIFCNICFILGYGFVCVLGGIGLCCKIGSPVTQAALPAFYVAKDDLSF